MEDDNNVIKNDSKNSSSKTAYVLMFVFLVCFIIALILFIYQRNEYNELKEKYDSLAEVEITYQDYSYADYGLSASTNDLEENIEVEALGIAENGDFVIKVTNNNDEAVNIESVETIFKDEDGTFIKKVETYDMFFCVDANSEVIVYNWGYDEDFSQYAEYEFEVSLSNIGDSFLYNNFEILSTDTGDQISIQVTNNNSESIESMEVNVAYYLNGTIVGIESGYSDSTVAEGENAYINVDYPVDSDYDEVEFDEYEVYLISANTEY